MLEVTGTISSTSQTTAAVTLAKCVSGSVGSLSSSTVTATKITVHDVTGTIVAGSSLTATSTKFKPGTGTIAARSTAQGIVVKGDPVGNPTQLSNIRNNLAKEYVLLDNIDLSGIANWEPIGTQAAPFTGILKGNGFAISNLTIDRPATDYVGLFGCCQFNNSAKIPNLRDIGISNASVSGHDYVGIVAGKAGTTLGSTGNAMAGDPEVGVIISGCATSGSVTGRTNVGGIFGLFKGPQFAGHIQSENTSSYSVNADWIGRAVGLTSSAAVTGSGENIGGLIGQLYELSVRMSNSTGTITGGDIVGGIVGFGYRCDIENCYTTGNVTGIKRVGGLVGIVAYRCHIMYCYTEGNVTGTGGEYPGLTGAMSAGVGGLIGAGQFDFLHYCYSRGDVSAVYRAGGLVGSYTEDGTSAPNIFCCYARGNISVSGGQVGGLIGFIWPYFTEIVMCYCTGSVTGNSRGAIIGERGSNAELGAENEWLIPYLPPDYADPVGEILFISDCFHNKDVNTASTQHGGIEKTSLELQKRSTYETSSKPWKYFDAYWIIDDEEGDLYPQLKCFYEPYGLAVSLIRGAQGLTLAYLKQQELYYRQLSSGIWGADTKISGIAQANTLNTFRTIDNRLGFVVDEAAVLKYALTAANSMTIDSIKAVTRGTYGDIVQSASNEAFLIYVTDAGSLNQLVGSTVEGWSSLAFDSAKPIPSDSQIAHLRANIYGNYGYVVWRSRGQHRLMVMSLEKAEQEVHLIRNGSISMSLDSPVVSMNIEFDEGVV